jgi:hypothetical protein
VPDAASGTFFGKAPAELATFLRSNGTFARKVRFIPGCRTGSFGAGAKVEASQRRTSELNEHCGDAAPLLFRQDKERNLS